MKQPKPFVIVDGQTFFLYKRKKGPTAPWWFRLQMNGKRKAASTQTTDPDQAIQVAEPAIREALQGRWEKVEQRRQTKGGAIATIGQIVKLVPKAYGDDLVEIVSAGYPGDIKKLPIDVLSAALVGRYQAKCQGLPRTDYAIFHESNVHANTVLRNVKAIFSRRRQLEFEKAGLNLCKLDSLLEAKALAVPLFQYSTHPLKSAQMARIKKALPSLKATAPGVHADLLKVMQTGVDSKFKAEHDAWLKQFDTSVQYVRWHVAAVWFLLTGSIKLAAEKMDINVSWAKWHVASLRGARTTLTLDDL